MNEIFVKEVLRAGDVFLFKVICPKCLEISLENKDHNFSCSTCGLVLESVIYDIDRANKRNLVAIIKKHSRKRITKKDLQFLRVLQDNCCGYCYMPLETYHVDHIFPIAAGGSNHVSNLVLSCPKCNLTASCKVFKDLNHKREYILSIRYKKGNL